MSTFAGVHRASKLFELPEFVKTAEYTEPEHINALPRSAFADPINRRWPMHTKSACWLSNAEFWEENFLNTAADPRVGRALLKAAELHEIMPEVKQVIEKVAADANVYEEGVPDESYALVFTLADTKQRHFPVVDAQTTKAAAANLYDNRFKLTLDLRKQAAAKIQAKCGEFGVMLDPQDPVTVYMTKAAGQIAIGQEKLAEALQTRNLLLGDHSQHQDVRSKLTELAKSNALDMTKAASVLDSIDVHTGLYRYYGKGLDLPEELVELHLEKQASDADDTVKLQTGTELTRGMLEKAGSEAFNVLPAYRGAVHSAGKFDVEAAMEILPTLPRDDARLFEHALSASSRSIV